MGLFDFFKGRGRKRHKEIAMGGDQQSPRTDHYLFPHVVVRQFAFGSPYMCLGALGSSESPRFLGEMLASVAEYCAGEGEEMTLTVEQLRVHNMRVNKNPCLIIEMPEPRAASEVYLVGIVLKPSPGETAADLPSAEVRFFTLEQGLATGNSARTVLCEWTADSKHLNYGDGPVPDVKKFCQALAEKCP